MRTTQFASILGLTAVALLAIVFLGVRNYGGNVSVLLHMDQAFGKTQQVPHGLVLYKDGGYDGMLYYQVARDIPALFFGGHITLDSPYRFQRIVFPLLTSIVTLGHEGAFPMAMLLINIASALASLWVLLLITKKTSIHAFAVVFNPAILVGILYMLTEPLSLLFVVIFFYLWERNGRRLDVWSILALIVSLFARETTVFLIALFAVWHLWHRQWKQMLLVLIPVIPFILWQLFLNVRFGHIGFQANGHIMNPFFNGPRSIVAWTFENPNVYHLSSFVLLIFVILLLITLAREWILKKGRVDVFCFLTSGLAFIMLLMDPHMWGDITSIGRIITPVYPVYALYAAQRDTWTVRMLSVFLIVISVVAAVGIASIVHPTVIS